MKVHSNSLSSSVARSIALRCAALFVSSARTASAGINIWTSDGPDAGGPVYALAIDPTTPSTLYAGTLLGGGVFKSTDGAMSWQGFNTGLPSNDVTDGSADVLALAIDATSGTLYSGTYGADGISGRVFSIEQVAACIGDCGGTQTVAVDDLSTLVNIALGTAPASACSQGVPSDTAVDVTMIIQAVNNALNGCG